jgi:hypothetical protein
VLLFFVFPVFCGQALYVSVFCWGSVGNAACRGVIWSFVVHCIVTNGLFWVRGACDSSSSSLLFDFVVFFFCDQYELCDSS